MDSKHPDRVTALAGGFVAVMALVVSSYNVYLQRQQVRAQVWPRLQWAYGEGKEFRYRLLNNGVGPAEVRGVRVTVDRQPVPSWDAVLERVLPGRDFQNAHIELNTVSGRVIGPGAEIEPFHLFDEAMAKDYDRAQQRVRVEVCYCSALEDCFIARGFGATPVSRCPKYDVPFQN